MIDDLGTTHAPVASLSPGKRTAPPPRFAQLTYTSFDRGDGSGGGWQIKDTRGALSAEERRFLGSRVATGFDTGDRLPSFPTPAELEALPRRTVYGPVPNAGGAAYWHTVPAGTDSSGRPGNVFAHVLLDRFPAAPHLPVRPTDLVDAPQWLRPFGAADVLAATLDGVPDPPWGPAAMNPSVVVPFLVEVATYRPGVLAALLDAVHAAMNGGPPVALAMREPGRGPLWIAGINHLMSPGTSRRLFWSSREQAMDVGAAWSVGLHLAVVAQAELAEAEPDGRTVFISDVAESVELGDLGGGPHRTRSGSTIPVTPWSVIASVVLQDPELAARAMRIQDDVAREQGDTGLPCGWPLAWSVTRMPDDLGDAREEALQLLGRFRPTHVQHAPRLRQELTGVLAQGMGRTTADAWARANESETGDVRDHAVNVYLERALGDREWLAGKDAPLLPIARECLDPRLFDVVPRLFDAELAQPLDPRGTDRRARALRVLRMIDLATRAGLAGDRHSARISDLAYRLVGAAVAPLLADTEAIRFVVGRTRLSPTTAEQFVRPWLDRHLETAPGAPGHRMPTSVLRWAYPVPPTPPEAAALRTRDGGFAETLVELAAQATAVTPDPSAYRALAVWAVLREQPASPHTRSDVARLAAGPPIPTAELRALVDAFDPLALAPALMPFLLATPDGEDLQAVVEKIRRPRTTAASDDLAVPAVAHAADLRHGARTWWTGREPGDSCGDVRTLLDRAESLFGTDSGGAFHPAVRHSLIAAYVADAVCRPVSDVTRPRTERWVDTLVDTLSDPASEAAVHGLPTIAHALVEAVTNGVVPAVDLAAAAQCSTRDLSGAPAGPNRWQELPDLAVELAGRTEPLLEHVLRSLLEGHQIDHVSRFTEQVRRRITELSPHADTETAAYEPFMNQWWLRFKVGSFRNARGSARHR